MSVENKRSSMEKTISYLKANPEKAIKKATAATAVLEKIGGYNAWAKY